MLCPQSMATRNPIEMPVRARARACVQVDMVTRFPLVPVLVRLDDFDGGIWIDYWHDVSVSNSARPHSIVIDFEYSPRHGVRILPLSLSAASRMAFSLSRTLSITHVFKSVIGSSCLSGTCFECTCSTGLFVPFRPNVHIPFCI